MTTDDLLGPDERDEVACIIPAALGAGRRAELETLYLEARVAGLCREGAIELLRDAIAR
ncbi:MAG: hypothetical protein AB7F65_09525 [Dehalococcoidia bacterium]